MYQDLVSLLLRNPHQAADFSLRDWDLLVRQARQAGLLARIFVQLQENELVGEIPEPAHLHLESALTIADRQALAVKWEVRMIQQALAPTGVPVILLKGAAYVMADLPSARGRAFSDVDILVPEAMLAEVEAALMLAGWHSTHRDPYDQRYYRTWMHEIPPMQHRHRGTVVDVHHGILPRTARLKPDPDKLLAAAIDLINLPDLKTLAPIDMVLHSATHLFSNEELAMGLRDLSDLDILLRHFGKCENFWDALPQRAAELGLSRPLYYAVRYAVESLGTPAPLHALRIVERAAPPFPARQFMDGVFRRMLKPHHESLGDWLTPGAGAFSYIRGHWLRMPLHLLLPHLFHKAFLAEREENFKEKERAADRLHG